MAVVHTSKMSADTSWCSEGLSGGDRNPGVEPVEYLWRPRGSYFYLVREIALAESSRETRKIYPRYFALSPAYPALPSLTLFTPPSGAILASRSPPLALHPALFIQRALSRALCRVFSGVSVRARLFSLFLLFVQHRQESGGVKKNDDGDVFHRERGGPFYLGAVGFAESLNVASETC